MFMKSVKLAAAAAALFATSAAAESVIEIHHPYALSSGAMATAGAAFFVIVNTGDTDDQLIDARSDVSARTELHTHIMENGVAKMRQVEGGFPVPAGGEHVLERGADHVMFMGLNAPFVDGETIHVTLVFREAGEIEVEIPVDLNRTATMMDSEHGAMHGSEGGMDHAAMGHSHGN